MSERYGSRARFYISAEGNRLSPRVLVSNGQAIGTHVYVCGPHSLIADVRQSAAESGWPAASGTGLRGRYYNNETLSGPPVLTRLDPVVNFIWGSGQPDGSVYPDHFSAAWIGLVEPRYSETYSFIAQIDDGVRLWVNGQLLIDQWNSYGRYSGTVMLNAGQRYDIRMEYREINNHAQAQLFWSSPSQIEVIIPSSQIYPAP